MAQAVPKLTWQEKLTQATEHKNEGNALYSKKQYKTAMKKYHQAMLYVRAVESTSEGVPGLSHLMGESQIDSAGKEETTKLKIACLNNLAACMLQLDEPNMRRVLEQSDQVLALDANNLKALYRKAQAHYKLNETDKALESLNKASKLPGGSEDVKIRQLTRACREKDKKDDEKVKQTYKNMFEQPKPS